MGASDTCGEPALDRDPLSPWYGEASSYEVVAPGRGSLVLHPSRVIRFLGNEVPDPSLAGTVWSDSVLLALYDAIHAVALQKAQATQVYAGLGLWPAAVTARLVEAQLAEDGSYPNAGAVFAEAEAVDPAGVSPTLDYDPDQPRDLDGRWTTGGGESSGPTGVMPLALGSEVVPKASPLNASGGKSSSPSGRKLAQEVDPDEETRMGEPAELQPGDVLLVQRLDAARQALRSIDPGNRALASFRPTNEVPTEAEVQSVEQAAREASIARTCDFLRPDGQPIGQRGTSSEVRVLSGGLIAAQPDFDYLSVGGTPLPMPNGSRTLLPGGAGFVTLRPVTSTPGSPAIDVNIPGVIVRKLHY